MYTTIDPEAIIQEGREKLAKELNKSIEDLTEDEKDRALRMVGLCSLDFDIP
jgi:hypothetical protein